MRLEPEAQTLVNSDPLFDPWSERPRADGDHLLDWIVAEAARLGATYLHLEPVEGGALVRARIAGSLLLMRRLDAVEWQEAEQRVGERAVGMGADAVHLACREGERIVLPLESAEHEPTDLISLGMSRTQAATVARTLAARSGLVLVAGSAESGRAATLHALARRLAQPERSLILIDAEPMAPLPGVAQVAGASETPAKDLASALAQDPDYIVLGEIGDRETALLAVEAAQSGKLVLAGATSSDAVGAVMRFREWKVPPFGVALALRLAMAQRLVKRLCGECREPVQAQGSVSALLGFDPGAIVYAPRGCPRCDSGYQGETGVFELAEIDEGMRRLISDGGDRAILASHAFLNAPNLGSSARAMVREGLTSADEAVRISRSGAAALL